MAVSTGSVMKKSTRLIHKVLTLFVVGIIGIGFWGRWRLQQASFDPRQLRYPLETYVIDLPLAIRHCLVPKGTSETELLRTFGEPLETMHTETDVWNKHVEGWSATGWSVPQTPHQPFRVLIYYVRSDLQAVLVYYFIDEDGHLHHTFVGET